VHGTLIQAPFNWYGMQFLRLTHDVSRRQEFIADQIAASVAGAPALASALRQVTALAPSFSAYLSNEVAPVVSAGFLPPIAAGFDDFIRTEEIASVSRKLIADAEGRRVTDEFATHPCLHDRLAALASLGRAPASSSTASVPASTLLPDRERLATVLVRFAVGAETHDRLKPVAWDAVGDHVYAPMWTQAAKAKSEWLGQFTADTIPSDMAALKRAGSALVRTEEEDSAVDLRVVRAVQILGVGIGILLVEHGWRVRTTPGKPLVLARGADVIDPFAVVRECAEGQPGGDRWKAQCAAIGIAGRRLGESPLVTGSGS
jgi:hypothetical protein